MIGEHGGISHPPRGSWPGDTSAPPTSTEGGRVEGAGDQMIGEHGGISHPPRGPRPGDTSEPPTSTGGGRVEGAGDQMMGEHGGLVIPPGDLGLGTPAHHKLALGALAQTQYL